MQGVNQYADKNGYYTSLEQIKLLYDKKGRQSRFTGSTKEEFIKWQSEKRELFKRLLGFDTFEPCDNEIIELEKEKCDGYTRIKYLLRTEEKVYLPFYALIPAGVKDGEKLPVMICPHGHFNGMKEAVAGIRGNEHIEHSIVEYGCNYGEVFCKAGYIAFCSDARGFGERTEESQQYSTWKCSCTQVNHMAIPLGRCTIGMSIWDLVKLCDYICTRDDCDVNRIGCGGLSGGGLQSLYHAAVDTRIKCIASSGYFYGVKDSLLELNSNCACNYVPHLWEHFDMCDIASLIAPRAFIVEAGTQDGLNGRRGMANVYEQVEITRQNYKFLNAEDKVKESVFDMGHMWKGDDIYPFFEKNLKNI